MYDAPTPDDLIEGVIVALQNDVMPQLTNPRAQAQVAMMQAVLQMARSMLPVYLGDLVAEHNAMTGLLRAVADLLPEAPGEAGEKIRVRAGTLGLRDDYPAPVAVEDVRDAHRALTSAITDTLVDIDTLQRAGYSPADGALDHVRAAWGPRLVREAEVLSSGPGMIGRS